MCVGRLYERRVHNLSTSLVSLPCPKEPMQVRFDIGDIPTPALPLSVIDCAVHLSDMLSHRIFSFPSFPISVLDGPDWNP